MVIWSPWMATTLLTSVVGPTVSPGGGCIWKTKVDPTETTTSSSRPMGGRATPEGGAGSGAPPFTMAIFRFMASCFECGEPGCATHPNTARQRVMDAVARARSIMAPLSE